MTIIAIENQKGGVAKTTSAVNMAHGAALRGYKTLLIDLDSQGNVADSLKLPEGDDLYNWLIQDEKSFQHYVIESGRARLDVIRSEKKTTKLKKILSGEDFSEKVLASALMDYQDDYDLVFFDTSPSVDVLHVAALMAADLLVIPTKLDQFAIKGVMEVIRSLNAVRNGTNCHCQLAGIIPTFHDLVTTESHKQLANLVENYEQLVWPPIAQDNTCRVANRKGTTLWEMPGVPKARTGYAECLDRLLKK